MYPKIPQKWYVHFKVSQNSTYYFLWYDNAFEERGKPPFLYPYPYSQSLCNELIIKVKNKAERSR